MTDHEYVRYGKIKNINCGYALVRGIVFPSVYAAKSYCTAKGLDVNTEIGADDPRVLAKCKQIAKFTIPTLRAIQECFVQGFNAACAKCEAEVKARDAAEINHELAWEVHNDWVRDARGKVGGFYDCMVLLDQYIETLEKVLRL